MAAKVSLKDLWFSYPSGSTPVLRNVNVDVEEGEVFVVAGQCGCGKSTLAKLMVGLLAPSHGRILIDKMDVHRIPIKQLMELRLHVGFLFQNSALISNMSIRANIALPLRYHLNCSSEKIDELVDEMITRGGLSAYQDKFPAVLSIGQRKRAAVARAVALNPKLMIYDEPTAGLDPINSLGICDIIRDRYKEFETTSVIITHDMPFAFSIADRIAIMYRGKIIFIGTPSEVKASKDPFIREFLGGYAKVS